MSPHQGATPRRPRELKNTKRTPRGIAAIGSTAQRINGSTALTVTTHFAHKINNITSPAPGKPTPMVYPSIRRDSQRCPTKAEGRTMAKQCKAIRPNPSGQPLKPCSHSFPRPVAAGVKNVPSCLAKPPSTGSPNPPISQLPNKPTTPQQTQIKLLTLSGPLAAPEPTPPNPTAKKSLKRCSHSFSRPVVAGVKNVPSCLAKPPSVGSPSPTNISITKQSHHAPTNSNHLHHRTARRAATNAAQPNPERVPKSGFPWDILGHWAQAKQVGHRSCLWSWLSRRQWMPCVSR